MPPKPPASPNTHITFTLHEPGILIQRYGPDARFTVSLIKAATRERDRLCGREQHAMLVVIHKSIPVNPDLTNTDHFRDQRGMQRITALAIHAADRTMRGVCKFYFKWFPQPFPVRVFDDEEEALAWLRSHVSRPI